jgi:hypothetical protein
VEPAPAAPDARHACPADPVFLRVLDFLNLVGEAQCGIFRCYAFSTGISTLPRLNGALSMK